MHLPHHRGSGSIKSIFLEEGFYLRYTRLRYYDDIEVIRLSKTPDSEIIFALCFLLTPASFKLIKPIFKSSPEMGYPNNVFLTSNNSRLSMQIPEGVLSHTIELLFSREWLYTHLTGMEERIMSITGELGEGAGSFIAGTTQPADDRLLSEIEFELHKPLLNPLTVRSRALMVMANIINRMPGPESLQ